MAIRANIELDAGAKTFATGLLLELIAALRRLRPGDLMAVIGSDQTLGTELEAWCLFTRNSLVDVAFEAGRYPQRNAPQPRMPLRYAAEV